VGGNLNLPLPPGMTDDAYSSRSIAPLSVAAAPSVIVVSLGFDTYALDRDVQADDGGLPRGRSPDCEPVVAGHPQEGGYHRPRPRRERSGVAARRGGRSFDPRHTRH
jgi:hypothetical protein